MMTIFKFIVILVLILIIPFYVMTVMANDENIIWSDTGNTYKLTPTDNTITENEYTIKAVQFPAPVRGMVTINGTFTERTIVPFVTLEIYKNIINNSNPIGKISLGVGDEYVSPDKNLRITIDSIPDGDAQDWVYEYYNPWATIKTQRRAVPNLDIGVNLTDGFGNTIDESNIKPGDSINVGISIKNTGEDAINDMAYNIDLDQSLLKNTGITNTLKDTVYQLNKDEEKDISLWIKIPVFLDEREYYINVSATGHDIDNVNYNFNASKTIDAQGDIGSISIYKSVAKNTTYIREFDHVILNIINSGYVTIDDIQIHDSIPDGLKFVNDSTVNIVNNTEIIMKKNSVAPSSSWTIEYNLKPEEPGIYVLPGFDANFSIGGRKVSTTTNEVGFRVFGPRVVLTKYITDIGNGIINVTVNAKNVGNGFTKVIIEDQLPGNTTLILGSTNLTTSLDAGSETTMNYGIKIENNNNIKSLLWPPARATYYLDDWRFTTSSDEKYNGSGIANGDLSNLGKGTNIVLTPVTNLVTSGTVQGPQGPQGVTQGTPEITVPAPKIEEEQKKVVATISPKTPGPTPGTPGFESLEFVFSLVIIVLLSKRRQK